MSNTRARQLEKLAMSLPQENQRVARAQQAARQIQLDEQLSRLQPGTGGTRFAQQVGAQQAQQAGQIQTQALQQTQQQAQALGQAGLSEASRGQKQQAFEQSIALSQEQRDIASKLAAMDQSLKNKLLDEQLTFKRNQAGQTLLNERQLADWALTQARSQEEFADYAQAAQQMHDRQIQILETAHKKLSQALEQGFILRDKPLDRETKKKLAQQKRALELKIQKERNAKANRASQFQAGGQILGTVLGAMTPAGPAGAAAGAVIGGGLGQILGGVLR